MFSISKIYAKLLVVGALFALCSFFAPKAYAVPAKPGVIKVTQGDGSAISLQLHGDEFFNWTTTENGNVVAEKQGNYYYASYQIDGKLVVSNERVAVNGRVMAPAKSIYKQSVEPIAAQVGAAKRAQRAAHVSESGFPSTGDVKAVVILVEYQDVKFTVENPNEAFHNQLNQENYAVEGATGSARDYFLANSGGEFRGEFDVYGPYTLSQPQRFYGGNGGGASDLRPAEQIEEAVELADKDGVDFSQYDYDGDGQIDNVFVYYAGRSEAEGGGSDCIWPHKWVVSNRPVFDGKELYVYACTSELRGAAGTEPIIAGIGTFCHEFSHVFGLADHYDTNGGLGGYSAGLGNYDIMTSGSYNNDGNTPPLHNGLERMMIGWGTPMEFDGNASITLAPINDGGFYKIPTETEGEFFLIENRVKNASVWDNYLPSEGLLIYHVDQSSAWMSAWNANGPNNDTSHECFRFIVAGNTTLSPSDYWCWVGVPYPYQGSFSVNDSFSPRSMPKAQSWGGQDLPFEISAIAKSGSDVTFEVAATTATPLMCKVRDTYTARPVADVPGILVNELGDQFMTMSDGAGVMIFSDPAIVDGKYTLHISASMYGYAQYSKEIDLKVGMILDVPMFTQAQQNMVEVKYHNDTFDGTVIGNYGAFRPMIHITTDMLKAHIGRTIEEIRFYAAAPFSGLVIVQPGLIGAGWGSDYFDITEETTGWKSVRLRDASGNPIVIMPDTEYYVKVMVATPTDIAPAIALDSDKSGQYNGFSNLIDNAGGSPSTIPDMDGGDGNLMFTLALSQACMYIAPERLSGHPDDVDGINMAVSEKRTIRWIAIPPAGATAPANSACNWTSSDESVVTVNGSGELMGKGAGSAVVTGTSVMDPSVTISFDVNVSVQEARAKGRVVEFNTENGIADVELKFYGHAPAPQAAPSLISEEIFTTESALKSARVMAGSLGYFRAESSDEVITATSDADGYYTVEGLATGYTYTIAMEEDRYTYEWRNTTEEIRNPLVAYVEGDESSVNEFGNFDLLPNTLAGTERMGYYTNPDYAAVGDNSRVSMYAIKLPKESLVDKIGYEFTHIEATVYQMLSPYVEYVILTLDPITGEPSAIAMAATGDNDEFPTEGYRVVEFLNQAPAIIRPDTDYYVAVTGIMQMGIELDFSGDNDGLSNLMWNGTRFVTLTEIQASFNGNFQISAFIRERAIDPVTSIEIAPVDPTADPIIGVPYQLSATLAPTTAIYDEIVWSSSNEEVATVNERGTVEFLAPETVVITATSVKYPDVKCDYTINPELVQGVEATVINSDGNLVSNATVKYYAVVEQPMASGMAMSRAAKLTRSSDEPVVVATTDITGKCFAELPVGSYQVEVTHDGLIDYFGYVDVVYGMNFTQMMMFQYVETLSTFMTWTQPAVDAMFGDASYNFMPYTIWEASDLAKCVGDQITRFKVLLDGAVNIRFVVYEQGNTTSFLYRSGLIEVGEGMQMVIHDIPAEKYITIEQGKSYCLGFEVSGYAEDLKPAIISLQSPTVSGKSDCIIYRNEFTDLTTLVGAPSGSWVFGFYVQSAEQLDGIDLKVGQTDASMSWNPAAYTNFKVIYGVEGEATTSVDLTDCQYDFTNLTPGTKYVVTVQGSDDGEDYIELFSTSFTTIAQQSLIPMIQLPNYDGYPVGRVLSLSMMNTTAEDQVVWYCDGEEVTRGMLTLTAGEHEIKAIVTRGTQEYVAVRYINVNK